MNNTIPFGTRWLTLVCLGFALVVSVNAGQPASPLPNSTNALTVFGMPALDETVMSLQMQLMMQFKQGHLDNAAQLCQRVIDLIPFAPDGYYNMACIRSLQGRCDEAVGWLEKAVEHGFGDSSAIERDPDLKAIRRDARVRALIKKMSWMTAWQGPIAPPSLKGTRVSPAPVSNGVAWVSSSNTLWEGRAHLLVSLFDLGSSNAGERAICTLSGEAGDLLRGWWKEGTAAGNWGDFYDNRDSGHSDMNLGVFPQMTRIKYGPEVIAAKLHYGSQGYLFHGGVVIGNSSTANVGGPFWGSQTRALYNSRRGVELLAMQYLNGKLYMYPEHQDYDPGRNGKGGGFGDVFACNTPYLITSQGSSGSDQVFLSAVACTLAAFRPEVKTALTTNGLLMATVQMIFRSSNAGITNEAAYLSSAAHPAVFDGARLDVPRMVRMAHAMTLTNLPPLVMLQVEKEDQFKVGRDYFSDGAGEMLFNTPCSIARLWKATAMTRKLVVSAAASRDPNKRPLTFRWVVLQGDPDKIRIRPLDKAGSRAEITLTWQGRHPVAPGSKMESNRIELGVFAHNGAFYSAPAFISYYTYDNEERVYDQAGRIVSVTYTGADEPGNYTDPLLDQPKSWRDEYHYDTRGELTGWTRFRGAVSEDFLPDGRAVVRRDGQGRVAETRTVSYEVKQRKAGEPVHLVEASAAGAPKP